MRAAVFSIRRYEPPFLEEANRAAGHELALLEETLHVGTAPLARGYAAVCAFANDRLDAACLAALRSGGTELICLRSVGFNHVDVPTADALGFTVLRVPAYSPHAVAEHTVALMLALDRHIPRAWARVREHDFSLEGLMGVGLHGRTVGVVGTGRIGAVVVGILRGFGCRVLAVDPIPDPRVAALGATYVALESLWSQCDIVTLHCPLTPGTRHLVDEAAIRRMKRGAMLINTSRGAVVDSRALLQGLKEGRIGRAGLDVYEEEGDLFFRDLSDQVLQDDVLARLLTFPNVLVTAHQAFFTREAVAAIARVTIANLTGFEKGAIPAENRVTVAMYRA